MGHDPQFEKRFVRSYLITYYADKTLSGVTIHKSQSNQTFISAYLYAFWHIFRPELY